MAAGRGVCAREGEAVRARGCRRSLPVTGRGFFSRAQPGESGRPPVVLAAGILRPSGAPLAASVLAPASRPPASRYCTPPGAAVPELQATPRLSLAPPTTSEGLQCCLAAVFWSLSPEESALAAAVGLAGRSDAFLRALQLQPGSWPGPSRRAGRRWSPESTASPPPTSPKFVSLLFRGGGSAPRGSRAPGPQLGV